MSRRYLVRIFCAQVGFKARLRLDLGLFLAGVGRRRFLIDAIKKPAVELLENCGRKESQKALNT
jgi:hypothetical protein